MVTNYREVLYDNENINSERMTLRKFKKEDAQDVYEYGSDLDTLKFIPWGGVHSINEALNNIVNYYWSRPGIWAIELKENKKCIGCIELRLEPNHDKAIFAYLLNKKYWGRGYMTEVLLVIFELGFDKLCLNRIEAPHCVGNEGSGRVMKKCGMDLEGIHKQEVKYKGVFYDKVHYGITKEKWLSLTIKSLKEK